MPRDQCLYKSGHVRQSHMTKPGTGGIKVRPGLRARSDARDHTSDFAIPTQLKLRFSFFLNDHQRLRKTTCRGELSLRNPFEGIDCAQSVYYLRLVERH